MKIRIKGNSIRYRVTQSEVALLAETGLLLEKTCFGPGAEQQFFYALETRDDIDHLHAAFQHNRITMFVPAQAAKIWPNEERIGFEQTIQVTPDTNLFLLLEKDFVCLDKTDEDQSDNYPHPHEEQKDGSKRGFC